MLSNQFLETYLHPQEVLLIFCTILYFNTHFQGRIELEGTSILEVTPAQII